MRPDVDARERFGDLARPVRRRVVDDEQTHVRELHQLVDEQRQIVALVVGRDDDQRRHRRPSKRSDEICSETRPTRKITTLNRISSTDELVTCACVKMVHTAYAAPTRNAAALIGRKIRSGLKIVITLSRMSRKPTPSAPRRIFELPSRCRASTGSKRTLYPALMNASVVVVGVENPFGSRCRNSSSCSRRAARNPDVRSGIGRSVR